jgi:DNA-binding MarR family transcriptional regulator
MHELMKKFQTYLSETIGLVPCLTSWPKEKKLPQYLQEICSFYTFDLNNSQQLVMMVKGENELSPKVVAKYIDVLAEFWSQDIIYLHKRITSYNRKRFIERKISFVIPGSQMYLPLCGLDLREHFQNLSRQLTYFGPSAQAVILSVIYGRAPARLTPSSIAEKLNYSPMTMTRALNEIKAAGLCAESVEWRERVVHFEMSRKSLWEKANPQMKTPVKKRSRLLLPPEGLTVPLVAAGESALARYNMLDKPDTPVYAVSAETWKNLLQIDGVIELEFDDPDSIQVEVWKCRPELFAKKEMVDPLSLYLSMRDTADERISAALDKLMTFVNEGLNSSQRNT